MDKNFKEKTKEFLSSCDGMHENMKMLHWSTTNKAEHLLSDEIDGDVLGYQDKIAEAAMGCLGTRFGFGDLKAMVSDANNMEGLLKDFKADVLAYKAAVGDEPSRSGIQNIIDDILTDINKWDYLRTLK